MVGLYQSMETRMESSSLPRSVTASQPMRGPFTLWPRAADALLAMFVFLWSVFVTDEEAGQDLAFRAANEVPMIAIIAFAVACCALYWRRHQPLVVLGINFAVLAFLTVLRLPNAMWSLPFALYGVGRYATNDRWSYTSVFVALCVTGISTAADGEPAASIGFSFVFVFLIWYIGRYIRVRGEYLTLIQERTSQLEREQEAEARRAVADERTRIARELHDVVAHRVSLMTVQAGAAKTIAQDNPTAALRAMEAVESAGREALDELRHLMGVLRPETEVDALGPQPRIADIPRLVEQINEAGLKVSLTMSGELTDLPARVELSAYRIVQEALTNVLKHAGPNAETEVRISNDNQHIEIDIRDNGHGATILPGTGHGIAGMRERAHLLGGNLVAERRPEGGFSVVAHFPMGELPG